MFDFKKECLSLEKRVCLYEKTFGFSNKCLALGEMSGFKPYDM